MPTDETRRVNEHRTRFFDQVPFLIEKGGKGFLRSLANLRGLSVSELIRRSVLHDAGLRVLPYPADLESMDSLEDRKEIARKLRRIQNKERVKDPEFFNALADDAPNDLYNIDLDLEDAKQLYRLCGYIRASIRRNGEADDPLTIIKRITVSGKDIALLRRAIANREKTQAKY